MITLPIDVKEERLDGDLGSFFAMDLLQQAHRRQKELSEAVRMETTGLYALFHRLDFKSGVRVLLHGPVATKTVGIPLPILRGNGSATRATLAPRFYSTHGTWSPNHAYKERPSLTFLCEGQVEVLHHCQSLLTLLVAFIVTTLIRRACLPYTGSQPLYYT